MDYQWAKKKEDDSLLLDLEWLQQLTPSCKKLQISICNQITQRNNQVKTLLHTSLIHCLFVKIEYISNSDRLKTSPHFSDSILLDDNVIDGSLKAEIL